MTERFKFCVPTEASKGLAILRQRPQSDQNLRDLNQPPMDFLPNFAGHRQCSIAVDGPSSLDAWARNAHGRPAERGGGRTIHRENSC
jgi:hypothetical protein